MRVVCVCGCHVAERANARGASQIGKAPLRVWELAQRAKNVESNLIDCAPEVTDVLEAAVACDACRSLHSPALLDHPTPRDRDTWIDPPRSADAVGDGEGQADGEPDGN